MRKILTLLLALCLLFSAGAAGAAAFPLKGYDWDGNRTEITLPEDCRMIIVDCWQPWCYWCLEGMPDFAELYEQYKDQGLLIIGLYSYTDVDGYTQGKTARELAEECGVTYPVLRISEEEMEDLAQTGFPIAFILTGEGEYSGPLSHEELVYRTEAIIRTGYIEPFLNGEVPVDDPDYEFCQMLAENEEFRNLVVENSVSDEDRVDSIIRGYYDRIFWESVVKTRLGLE